MTKETQEEKQDQVIFDSFGDLKFYRINRTEMPSASKYGLVVLSSLENLKLYIEQEAKKHFPSKKFEWDAKEPTYYQQVQGVNFFHYEPLRLPEVEGVLRKKSLEETVKKH